MKSQYDLVFVTHLPAFYKVNLYHEIAKHCRIFVIFIATSSTIRSIDFFQNEKTFDYHIIGKQDSLENRNIFFNLLTIFSLLQKISFQKVILGGWDLPEYWFIAWMTAKKKNALAVESSLFESKVTSWRKKIKQIFLSRIVVAFPSGEPHMALLKILKPVLRLNKTLGVGILNYSREKRSKIARCFSSRFRGKFLYVGRLAREKNLLLLIEVFRQLPQYQLTLIGEGPLESILSAKKIANVTLLGHIANKALGEYYLDHDVFILPSLAEPWGLVIEEALYYGLPVIASNRVGCAIDWVINRQVGITFDPKNSQDLYQSVLWVVRHYEKLISHCRDIDFDARDRYQIQQYLEILA